MGLDGRIWDRIEFSHEGELFDWIFHIDANGDPHTIKVTDGGPMPRAPRRRHA